MPKLPLNVARLARQQHQQLNRLSAASLTHVQARLARVSERLVAELPRLNPDGFRAQQARIALFLAKATERQTVIDLEDYLAELGAEFASHGSYDSLRTMAKWADHYGQEFRPVNLQAVAAIDAKFLVEHYAVSIQTWGYAAARTMRQIIGDAVLERASREGITDRVNLALATERWRAERIVRTEIANAYNNAHHRTLVQARELQIGDVRKTAIVTFDIRTDPDSFPMDGQVRDLNEPFRDGDGRRFLHPPGRPNDREKEVPWMGDIGEPLPEAYDGGDPRDLPDRFREEIDQARKDSDTASGEKPSGKSAGVPRAVRKATKAKMADAAKLARPLTERDKLLTTEITGYADEDETITQGVNETRIVTLADGRKAVFKPIAGEDEDCASAYGVTWSLAESEVAASVLDDLLGGTSVVPTTVMREFEGQRGSLQVFVPGARVVNDIPQINRAAFQTGGPARDAITRALQTNESYNRVLALDAIMANADRHHFNAMMVGELGGAIKGPNYEAGLKRLQAAKWVAIDNGMAFGELGPTARAFLRQPVTNQWFFADDNGGWYDVMEPTIREMTRDVTADDIRRVLTANGIPARAADQAVARFERMKESPGLIPGEADNYGGDWIKAAKEFVTDTEQRRRSE